MAAPFAVAALSVWSVVASTLLLTAATYTVCPSMLRHSLGITVRCHISGSLRLSATLVASLPSARWQALLSPREPVPAWALSRDSANSASSLDLPATATGSSRAAALARVQASLSEHLNHLEWRKALVTFDERDGLLVSMHTHGAPAIAALRAASDFCSVRNASRWLLRAQLTSSGGCTPFSALPPRAWTWCATRLRRWCGVLEVPATGRTRMAAQTDGCYLVV